VAPRSDDAVNRQNYKTEHHPLRSALLTDDTDEADDVDDAEETSAGVAEHTGFGWKTGPASSTHGKISQQVQHQIWAYPRFASV